MSLNLMMLPLSLVFYSGANVLPWLEITVARGMRCVHCDVQGDLGYCTDKSS